MLKLKKVFALLVCAAMLFSVTSMALAADFTDVAADSSYKEAFDVLMESGVVKGVGNGRFSPDKTVTTAELVTFLGRLAGASIDTAATVDGVKADGWSNGYIVWAKQEGIIADQPQYQALSTDEVNAILHTFCALNGAKPVDVSAPTRGDVVVALHALEKAKGSALTGTQTVVMEGFDWGPAITKTIVTFDQPLSPDSVTKEGFCVTEKKEGFAGISTAERKVINAYTSDEKGNKVEGASKNVTLELSYDPNTGSPYFFDFAGTMQNRLASPYNLIVSLTGSSALKTEAGEAVEQVAVGAVDLTEALCPQLEGVDLTGKYTGKDGKTLTYGSFEPKDDGNKHPLVIWLHGMGEGGTDPSVALLGNKVTALLGEEFQTVMGGAYVLTPQTTGFWLSWDESNPDSWGDNPGKRSIYTDTLMELIQDYVAKHTGIDTDRIYIGGCSNGGYMTMNMIFCYPDYFAAAYPICEAYKDAGITDELLTSIKDLPVWFVYAENDTTVKPEDYEAPTIERLKKIGGNIHTSVFDDVHDTTGLYTAEDGSPYQYMGHWSWLYFFNNECTDNGTNLWEWMAAQKK